jgi:hypothetical protein
MQPDNPHQWIEALGSRQPHRRGTGLWVWIAGLVLVVLIGGVVFALPGPGGIGTSESTPTTSSLPPVAFPVTPLSPGLEPPKPGVWPAQWPKFTDRDDVRTLTDLGGLGFPVKVPQNWRCIPGGRAEGFAKYYCGDSPGKATEVGGELIVRDCPKPCTEEQQATKRKAEEAWGVQWVRSGQFSVYGETLLQMDGAQRHALVVVAYWSSGRQGAIDRQLVLRMTAPVDQSYQLRRFANYLRDTVIF